MASAPPWGAASFTTSIIQPDFPSTSALSQRYMTRLEWIINFFNGRTYLFLSFRKLAFRIEFTGFSWLSWESSPVTTLGLILQPGHNQKFWKKPKIFFTIISPDILKLSRIVNSIKKTYLKRCTNWWQHEILPGMVLFHGHTVLRQCRRFFSNTYRVQDSLKELVHLISFQCMSSNWNAIHGSNRRVNCF